MEIRLSLQELANEKEKFGGFVFQIKSKPVETGKGQEKSITQLLTLLDALIGQKHYQQIYNAH